MWLDPLDAFEGVMATSSETASMMNKSAPVLPKQMWLR
jgi:hypothetical protein